MGMFERSPVIISSGRERPVPCLAIAQAVQPGIPVIDAVKVRVRDVVCSGMPAPDPESENCNVQMEVLERNTTSSNSSGPGRRTSSWRVQWRERL